MTWDALLRTPVESLLPADGMLSRNRTHPFRLWADAAEERQERRLLLSWASGCSTAWLLANSGEEADAVSATRYVDALTRRLAWEPVAYIVGSAGFFGLDFFVTPDVLIPRPETELLVEVVSAHLDSLVREGLRLGCGPEPLGHPADSACARAASRLHDGVAAPGRPEARACVQGAVAGAPRMLDVGTGSGCISVTLLRRHPQLDVTALDISPGALAVARRNAAHHGVDGRICFLEGDLLAIEGQALRPPYDIVVSNPPYIPAAEIGTLMPDVRCHEPRGALDGGVDGLVFYRRLAALAGVLLRPGGLLAVEIGWDQGEDVPALFRDAGLDPVLHRDLEGRARVVAAVLR